MLVRQHPGIVFQCVYVGEIENISTHFSIPCDMPGA